MANGDLALDQLIDTYCAAWSDSDAARRRETLANVWAEGATYTDPTVHAVGIDDLLTHIDAVARRRPGAKVVRTSRVDAHHHLARFAWCVVLADGTSLPESIDIAELSAGGQIRRIIGFFGPLAGETTPNQ
jgi:hypothetical protein